ncbi:MAG: ROK family protein [Ignavibacteriales bacterium]|nr:ROK family protein [Ignavibacteriales bacterium]
MRIGIDFGGTNVKFGLFEENGTTNKFSVKKLVELKSSNNLLLFNLLEETKKFIGDEKISCGGLSIKGLVNRKTGALINDIGAANEFAGVNLQKIFSEKLSTPFVIDNDARAYAFGEWRFGTGRNFDSVIVMTLGTGVGCAAVIDGKLFGSENPTSGVLGGHISIDRNGDECACGSRGCLELYCSASAFEKKVLNTFPELNEKETPLKIFFDESEKNSEYKILLEEFRENLAIGIINIIHAYGIDKIILGGGLMKSHEKIIPGLIEIVRRRAWTVPKGNVEILPAQLEDKAACIGAAFLDRSSFTYSRNINER